MTSNPAALVPTAPDSPAPPDWEQITHNVTCPLCEYNLRGLRDPLCPECGYRFAWPTVLDPNQRRHPYLFEHHPERNIWSFSRTLLEHLRPMRFWKTLDAAHLTKPARIVRYWAIYALVVFLPPLVGAVQAVRYHLRWSRPQAGHYFYYVLQSLGWDGLCMMALSAILLVLFPWFNFLALMVFQQSMRRSRIKNSHVARCAVYSGDVVLWYALVAVAGIFWLGTNPRSSQTEQLLALLSLGALVMAGVNGLRLWIAYSRYMKFRHALAAVFASQIMVGLSILAILLYVPQLLLGSR
jgi:hypothetical protein